MPKDEKINGAYFSIYISYIHCLRTLNALFDERVTFNIFNIVDVLFSVKLLNFAQIFARKDSP